MANIVVFGKAQSGKSTLLGYLYAQLNRNFNIAEFERKTRFDLASDYEPSYLYAYIMDDTRYERIVRKGTRNIHIRKCKIDDSLQITVIDTPGVEHHIKPKQKGVFLGDIGIFCIELKDALSDDFLSSVHENVSIMSTLLLWSNLGHKRIIVALTKCDECGYSESDYHSACERVHALCEKTNISEVITVPVAILVPEKKGMNIVETSDKFSWYEHETLYKILDNERKLVDDSNNGRLLFCVHNQIDKPTSNSGKVWVIKIIQGQISVGDEIILTPVLSKEKEFLSIKATVKKIREDVHELDDKKSPQTANAGEIVGLDLKNIYEVKGDKIEKKDFDTIYTTCGFRSDAKFDISDMFVFSVAKEYQNIFTVRRQFSLMWFGRGISFWIYEPPILNNNQLLVTGKLFSRKLALPNDCTEGYAFNKLIIKDGNGAQSNPYFEGKLIKIGENRTYEYI